MSRWEKQSGKTHPRRSGTLSICGIKLRCWRSLTNLTFLCVLSWMGLLYKITSWHAQENRSHAFHAPPRDRTSWAQAPTVDTEHIHVALVVPFRDSETAELLKSIATWYDIGDACSDGYKAKLGLFLYNNLDKQTDHSLLIQQLENGIAQLAGTGGSTAASSRVSECFSEIRTIYAELKPEEDGYPEGPSVMFFNLMLQERLRDDALVGYTHVMWMEWDTRPVRSLWLDAIVNAAAEGGKGSFWVRGSMYHGRGFDATVMYQENHQWVGHINGNALYYLRDPDFHTFLRLVMEREPPTDYWRPFDVSMWRVLNDFPYSWRTYQAYSQKFQYKGFIRHTSFYKGGIPEAWPEDLYLVHGDRNSAGHSGYFKKFNDLGLPTTNETLYGYEIRPHVRLSVLVRTFARDLDFAAIALRSAKRYIPYALEFVVVVPEPDYREARNTLPDFVVVRKEQLLMESQDVQQKYTKLNADKVGRPLNGGLYFQDEYVLTHASPYGFLMNTKKYCKGDFILHLDSDVVFFRMVNYKDLFVFGKPILEFDSYENLKGLKGVDKWQKGTSYALGRPVEYEYSRSNEHVYPRDIYAAARAFLERKFDMPLVDFLKTRKGSMIDLLKHFKWRVLEENLDKSYLFSDFNFIGAFMHYNMPDAVSWHFVGTAGGQSPFKEDAFRQVMRLPFTCQGNARWMDDADDIHQDARIDYHPEKRGEQLKFMNDIAEGVTTNCHALQWFLSTIEPVATGRAK